MSSTTYPGQRTPAIVEAELRKSANLPRSGAAAVAAVPSETGIWVAICAISMSFAALTSALVVREGSAADWQRFAVPPVLYLNSAVLLASSFTLERARKLIAASAADTARVPLKQGLAWLYTTLVLGLLFVSGQIFVWKQLAARGLFLASNPTSSFFYVLTALHGLHVLGGIAGLLYAAYRTTQLAASTRKNTALAAASVYWHFMDILWLYLLFIIAIRM
jgi:cytochrome c oxidase subunit III